MTSTCSLSSQCGDEGDIKCCVEIQMTSLEDGKTESVMRCMAEGVVQSNWEWTYDSSKDGYEDDVLDDMTVIMKCMDRTSAVYYKALSILAASIALIVSVSI